MNERLTRETEGLIRSWGHYDRATLQKYLVRDVEDPRINVQSILTRHYLLRRLFGDDFEFLMKHELRFALVVNWMLSLLRRSISPADLHGILGALVDGQRSADDLEIPSYVEQTFAKLGFPNYVCDLLNWAPVETSEAAIPDYVMSTFQRVWFEALKDRQHRRISVLEPACGSANDYRFIDSFGISRLLDYTGFDLCGKNIQNARAMFPTVSFRVGNVLQIDAPDHAFEYCFVHDLFEHLSPEALELAVAEICRVAKDGLCLGFFNMSDSDAYVVRPVRDYHWNTLSSHKMRHLLGLHASKIDVICIHRFLASAFGCPDTHNKNAYTLIVALR
jgi:hypothetical protein